MRPSIMPGLPMHLVQESNVNTVYLILVNAMLKSDDRKFKIGLLSCEGKFFIENAMTRIVTHPEDQ